MAEVAGLESGVLFMETSRQKHVRLLQRPYLNTGKRHQLYGRVKGLQSSRGQVSVDQFLENLCRSASLRALAYGFGKEFPGWAAQWMGPAHCVDEYIRIDEDHVPATLFARDALMTRRCSFQSGSTSGPSRSSQAWKNALTSSSEVKGLPC